MDVHDAIRNADALLPGVPSAKGEDPRWQAILEIEDFVQFDPEAVWSFVDRWGGHPQEDLRDAIACCLLEHLLECHFDAIFPRVKARAASDPLFGDMFLRCWQLGPSETGENAERFRSLRHRISSSGPVPGHDPSPPLGSAPE